MHQVLFDSVSPLVHLTDADKKLCLDYFKPLSLPKNTIAEKAGAVPGHQYFIVSGHMRNFHFNESGEEITTELSDGPRFFTAYHNFVHRLVSNENIQCVTACDLLRIARNDVDIMLAQSWALHDFTIQILEFFLEKERTRLTEMVTLSAEQRYLKLMATQPNIVKNVPLQYIASYLGIKPESLSRIRRNLNS